MELLNGFLPFALSSPIMEKPGPYEMQGAILAALLFVFTLMIVIGKFRIVRITASFLSAIIGGTAFVVYYINQTSVGNPLSLGPLFIFGAAPIYGGLIGAILIRGIIRNKKLKKEVEEKVADAPPVKRKFDD
jgi:TRAP-type C4-dicarboxylate transport system permease small subunit